MNCKWWWLICLYINS